MEGFGWYTFEITKRLVQNHPEHEFVFFFDRPFDPKFVFGPNVTPIVLSPPARHPFLFIYWFEVAVKRALKKYKIDVFFSPDGYLSLGSTVPQIAVIHDINFEHYPKDLPFSALKYLKHYVPKFAKKADKIITVSAYSKQDLIKQYQLTGEKIIVAWNGASDYFKPLNEDEKVIVRKKYSNDLPYFLFVGAIHPRKNVKRLIQAFVKFKHDTGSEVQLVIVGESLWKNNPLQLELSEKEQSQIHFTGHLPIEELSKITASALALTYVPYFEGFGIPLVEAMKCGTPIISGNLTSLPEVAGNAALYCDPFDVQDIAAKMADFYSDKLLQQQLALAGLERSNKFSWDISSEIVWEQILLLSNSN